METQVFGLCLKSRRSRGSMCGSPLPASMAMNRRADVKGLTPKRHAYTYAGKRSRLAPKFWDHGLQPPRKKEVPESLHSVHQVALIYIGSGKLSRRPLVGVASLRRSFKRGNFQGHLSTARMASSMALLWVQGIVASRWSASMTGNAVERFVPTAAPSKAPNVQEHAHALALSFKMYTARE